MCFAKQRIQHYLLFWRFFMLTCCCQHKCQLLKTCGYCDGLIPLFTAPFKLGYCSICLQRLKLCSPALVTDEAELDAAQRIQGDILFLLAPQLWEVDSKNIIKHVGQRLADLRQARHLTYSKYVMQVKP